MDGLGEGPATPEPQGPLVSPSGGGVTPVTPDELAMFCPGTSELIAGHDAMTDPVVKSSRNGVWYYAYIARGGVGRSDFDVFVRRSTDSGA